MGMNRIVRAQVMKLKEYEFVLASKTLGGSGNHIIFKHLLINLLQTTPLFLCFLLQTTP
jgi:oligopeptide transport system permease protein